jgi:hypothetical protein
MITLLLLLLHICQTLTVTVLKWQMCKDRAVYKNNVLNRICIFLTTRIFVVAVFQLFSPTDRLCGLVVRVPGYRSRGPRFDSRRYQIFWKVVGLERGPLSLVSTIEELLEQKSSGSGLENREYGCRDLSRWPHGTLYLQKLALTSLTSGGRSVGIVLSWTQATEFS